MKKKIVAMCATIALAAVAVAGGSLAYFTAEDAETNTFTVGNVAIHIEESMDGSAEDGIQKVAYKDNQTLAPVAQSKAPFNKMVETVNDGTESAYIRTFVTCPKDMYDFLGLGFNSGAGSNVGANANGKSLYNITWKDAGTFTINGEETAVFLCEVAGKTAVASGESVLSLTKVWLYDTVTNENVEAFDLTSSAFKVEVASQAIQAANLTYDEAMAELGAIDQALMDKLFG